MASALTTHTASMLLAWQVDLLKWLDGNLLGWLNINLLPVATVALAAVTVWATLRSNRHDTSERQRERRYARILQAQAALRLSATLAAEFDDSRSWRAKLVPVLIATMIGIGTVTRRWDFGRGTQLLTMVATSRHIGADSVQNTKAYAFLRSAYDVAGFLGQIGPQMPVEVIARLQQCTADLHKGHGRGRLQNYIDAVTAAHVELERIIRDEGLESTGRSISQT